MTDLRVLSLHQPWASLVAVGVKSIETRSWPTKHRGRIGIASTKREPGFMEIGQFTVRKLGYWIFDSDDGEISGHLPLGAIVATANLVDCVPIVDDGAARNCVDVRVARPNADAALRIDDEAGREQIRNVRDQVPYGDFTPGRWAWLLDDVKPTTERCPACWGESRRCAVTIPPFGGCVLTIGHDDNEFSEHITKDEAAGYRVAPDCSTCNGAGVCDPIPVKGHQGLWKWNP